MSWFINLSLPYKIIAVLVILGIGFVGGVQVTRWKYEADKVDELNARLDAKDKTINNLQDEVKSQSDIAKAIAADRDALRLKNQELTTKQEESYETKPAITTLCIEPIRVRNTNDRRKAVNSIRSRGIKAN